MASIPNDQDTEFWDEITNRLLSEADRGYAESWQPEEEGDFILGTLAHVTTSAPTAYGPAPVVEIATPSGGHLSVWLFPKVLRLAFERQRPALGERLLIRYEGKVAAVGGGNDYHNYTLVVDRPAPSGEVDWRDLADRYGDELDEQVAPARPTPEPGMADEEDIPF